MEFYIGQIFTDSYPPEAAVWCNSNNAYIERNAAGYEIKAVPDPTIDELRAAKLSEINSTYNTAASSLVSTYPNTELLTFDKQESEARAWDADNTAETPLVDMLALGRQMDKAELVRRIIVKADAFALATGYLTGQRQRYEDLLDAAATAEEIEAIVPEYKLPEAEDAAEDSMSAFFYNNL